MDAIRWACLPGLSVEFGLGRRLLRSITAKRAGLVGRPLGPVRARAATT